MSANRKPLTLGRGRGRGLASINEPSSSANAPLSAFRSLSMGRGVSPSSLTVAKPLPDQASSVGSGGFLTTKPQHISTKSGTSGKPVSLSSNYFKLVPRRNFAMTQYRVDFSPEVDEVGIRKAIVRQHAELFQGYLYDGDHILYLTHKLDEDRVELNTTLDGRGDYVLTVKNSGRQIDLTDQAACLIFNVILRRAMDGLKMQLVGRNLYDPKSKVALPEFKVELWPGYITSIRQHEDDTLVCCEVSHKVMRQETVYDIMRILQKEPGNWQDKFKQEILGSIVLTDYNNETYRIEDVDFKASPEDTFLRYDKVTKCEKQVTYIEYYESRSLRIKDRDQPMLVAKPRFKDSRQEKSKGDADKILYLVPELCRATGLTDKMRQNFQMMRAMAAHTQMDPASRTKRLLELTKRLHNNEDSKRQFDLFNVDIENDLVQFTGRALQQVEMIFGNEEKAMNDDKVDWTRPMQTAQMFQTVELKRWVLIYPKRASQDTEAFIKLMKEVAKGMNFSISDPKLFVLDNDSTSSYAAQLRDVIAKDPKFIVVVVPNNAADRYALIKKETYVNHAIPTQVIVLRTMQGKKDKSGNLSMSGVKSIATKVMIQINCKLGGAPWMVNIPMKGVMTIGFDVNHDTTDKKGRSFGAFVASLDSAKSVYYSKVTAHKNGNEMSQNIGKATSEALMKYKDHHGVLPGRIFFYRDGVADNQIGTVHSEELRQLNELLGSVYGAVAPRFTFIIVNKRINTRFFLNPKAPRNPSSGTVVDSTVTLPERYDFFLISQSVRQGTVSPTSYNVIYDSSGLSADKLQLFTYLNTHLYYNWCGTVRVPAVVQYAHKLALLVGDHIHALPNVRLEKLLYFL